MPNKTLTYYDVPGMDKDLVSNVLDSLWNITGIQVAKLVGGSMAHNANYWLHPSKGNVAEWDIDGWSFSEFLPYLNKVENATGSMWDVPGNTYNGFDGLIQLSNPGIIMPGDWIFANACVQAGFEWNPNYFEDLTGIGFRALNIRRGIRDSSANAYLAPILGSHLLTLKDFAQVTKVLFNGNTATGVQYVNTNSKNSALQSAFAKKEVILAASTILSPWILMNSGIGPEAELTKYGITPVLINNNVGQHMSNHLQVPMLFNSGKLINANFYNTAWSVLQYAANGTGLFSWHGYGSISLCAKTVPNIEDPDVCILADWAPDSSNPFDPEFGLTIAIPQPVYRNGTITLQSSDPLVDPVYTPNYLVNPADIQTIIRAINLVREIVKTPIAAANFGPEIQPGPQYQTDAELEEWITAPGHVGAYHHFMGTNKMGNTGDPLRVVDPELRVVGVNNLRVIDSSIVPGHSSQVLQSCVAGIAEKGAATLLSQYSASK